MNLALKFFETMTALLYVMWDKLATFNIVSFESVGITYNVSYGALIVSFGLLYVLVFVFFRSR